MLFLIFVALTVVGLIGLFVFDSYDHEIMFGTSCSIFVLSLLVAFCMLCMIITANVGVEGQIAKMQETYDNLCFQHYNDFYDTDNEVGKYELVKDIREWNEDLAYNKKMQQDFWLGIFIPDIYDEFEFISLEK